MDHIVILSVLVVIVINQELLFMVGMEVGIVYPAGLCLNFGKRENNGTSILKS